MLESRIEDLELRQRALAIRLDTFERKLDGNCEATDRVDQNTQELVSILQSWKGAFKVLDFLGKLAGPLTAILGIPTALWGIWVMLKR